ncbi:formyltetrahydrofolate deformylase [Solicola sp. PLA-1-18]|uniref:formyltetrahydrofolate deformylase n=1 Tax=Solicola sp. PLA-1-18 TaxID=3380532 RepID=UPI003B7BDDC2
MPSPSYVLTLACTDRPGIVHAVTGNLAEQGANILDSQQFGDRRDTRFFMRVHFDVDGTDVAALRSAFSPVAEGLGMDWELEDASRPCRTLIMVSRFGHCLNDLLFRQSSGALPIDVAAVVSNHRDLERLADTYEVPFHHVPVTPDTKRDAEQQVLRLVDELDVDLVVLARYMQILSDEASEALSGRTINIHHSFLPSFKGAKPYHQAFDRGVKLIGATAHYVTAQLDEGPIIEQDVTRVNHRMGPDDMVQAGRDVESQVLSRAVRWHAERRLLLDGSRVVVFSA